MDSLKLNQSVLTFIGVCAVEENTPLRKRIRIFCVYTLLFLMNLINTVVCSLYFFKYITIDYDGGIYAFLASTVLLCLLYVLIILRHHSGKLRKIFVTLNEINHGSKITWKVSKIKNFIENYFALGSFKVSPYASRVSKWISFVFIQLYSLGFFVMSFAVTSLDVMRCYFHDGLTNPKCLLVPYKYVWAQVKEKLSFDSINWIFFLFIFVWQSTMEWRYVYRLVLHFCVFYFICFGISAIECVLFVCFCDHLRAISFIPNALWKYSFKIKWNIGKRRRIWCKTWNHSSWSNRFSHSNKKVRKKRFIFGE